MLNNGNDWILEINKSKLYLIEQLPFYTLKEQDKSSDIEQQPPFGDRKISNIQPQNRGGFKTNRNII